jgi:hypothetical protein
MELAFLSEAQLIGVLAAASALTLALYLLKLRRRRVAVSFIPLWENLLLDRQASRLFARLRHLVSLLVSLLIVVLLALALGDPRERAQASAARHVVLLIDAGVTMQARDVQPSRLAAAISAARRLTQRAGPQLQVLVAQLDTSVTPLSGLSPEPRELAQALSRIAATDLPTDSGRGYEFALEVLRGRSNPELVLISDAAAAPDAALAQAFSHAGIRVSHVAIGRRGEDVGISAFAVRRYPLDKNRSELLLELYSAAPQTTNVTLTLLGDGTPIDVQQLTLAPGKSVRRIYDDVTGVSRTLEARLSVAGDHDDLRANDHAFALLPEKRRVRVLCVSEGNRFLEAALLLDEYLDVDQVTPAAYTAATAYDVVIFDRFVPQRAPDRPALYLAPDGQGSAQPLQVTGRIPRPFFDQLRPKHPVMRFTSLRDANVASALLVRPAQGDEVLAADARGPLIVAGKRSGQPFVALTFDLRESDLPLRVAWPLLLLNTIDWFSGAAQDSGHEGIVGRSTTLALPDDLQSAEVQSPDGQSRSLPVSAGKLVLAPTRVGLYRVSWHGGERWFAANPDPNARRDLTPQKQLRFAGALAPPPEVPNPGFGRPPWVALLLIAVLLLTAEWHTYHRRWTV